MGHEGHAYHVQAMGEQKLIQDLGEKKIKKKADREAINIGCVKTEEENQSYRLREGVTLKASTTILVEENPTQHK